MTQSSSTRYLSPLRYPGGKAKLASFVGELLSSQSRRASRYVEPFAGGGGVGLRLLFDEYVDEIVLNDLNPGIAAFWRALFQTPDDLIARIRECPVTVDEWRAQSAIYRSRNHTDLELGFATLFLNRTNRSGILDARPIGGFEQDGRWKIDARFNREGLITRVESLARYASRVTIAEEDGVALIKRELADKRTFVYADPPYLVQGDRLYLNPMVADDHAALARILRDSPARWLLTYDADPRISQELYAGLRCAEFTMTHSAAIRRAGSEFAVFPDGLTVNRLEGLGSAARWIAGTCDR